MRRLTNLPILFSTLFLWSFFATLGCGGTVSGNTTGSGGSGGSGTGGENTGGAGGSGTGGDSTGGANTGGSNTGGASTGGSNPGCSPHTSQMLACLTSPSLTETPTLPFVIEKTVVVDAVRSPNPGETCGDSFWYQVGWGPAPEVMIDTTTTDGAQITIGLAITGFDANAIQPADTLDLKYTSDIVGFGGQIRLLEVKRNSELVVAAGENAPAGVTPAEGDVECYTEDSLCGREDRLMDVTAPDGTAISIANGDTAQVGDLFVANERFVHNYDISGGCNFGQSVEYIMSAVQTQ